MINEPAVTSDPAALEIAPPQAGGAVSRPTRGHATKGPRLWTASLAIAVLATAGGLALLYNDDRTLQGQARSLTNDNESLQGQILGIQGELSATNGNLSTAQSDLAAVRVELAHPHLGMWTVRQTLQGPSFYLAAGVPDTFTFHVRLKSTGAMNVSILTFDQFFNARTCISNGRGDTNYCMHHSGAIWGSLGVTSVTYDFHLGEGCAGYMLVITAPSKVTVTPNVSLTYNPAPHATGWCR